MFLFNPNLILLQSSSSASWEGKAIHEALHIWHVSAKYFSLNIYALQSLKRYLFSVSSIIPTSFSPLISPVVSLFCERDLQVWLEC